LLDLPFYRAIKRSLQGPVRRRTFAGTIAIGQEFFETRDFVIGQTGQRGPLAGDARFRADIDQLFAVELQLFR